ncbi:hypothetical protein PK98_14875 [Croceibacterium mercuriale]|uniref:Uncharacterized protein n=1 Tax=Croceibacterium mercuriale TaxID=1572751 RepID=A0A0B2BWQ9_9SPHN|nr:hypothetical protein PK98_14875 [Croceibacterium mercuriale]
MRYSAACIELGALRHHVVQSGAGQDSAYVAGCFAKGGYPTMPAHIPGAGVVGAKRQMPLAELIKLLTEVARASREVLANVPRIGDPKPTCGARHKLSDADRAGRAYCTRTVAALLHDQAVKEGDGNARCAGGLHHISVVELPSRLAAW